MKTILTLVMLGVGLCVYMGIRFIVRRFYGEMGAEYECDKCGAGVLPEDTKCPKCGADMGGEVHAPKPTSREDLILCAILGFLILLGLVGIAEQIASWFH